MDINDMAKRGSTYNKMLTFKWYGELAISWNGRSHREVINSNGVLETWFPQNWKSLWSGEIEAGPEVERYKELVIVVLLRLISISSF